MSPAPQKSYEIPDAAGIERKAQEIGDPVARLKFLREVTTSPSRRGPRPWAPIFGFCIVAVLLSMRSDAHLRRYPELRRVQAPTMTPQATPNVWKVDETKDFEVYSNGLRIENQLAVSNTPRSYQLLSLDGNEATTQVLADPPGAAEETPSRKNRKPQRALIGPIFRPAVLTRTVPAGIVFHTTESDQAPFEATQQRALKRITRETLLFVRNKRAYHFVIDRFGRVHRMVAESDAANHAGNSVWADSRWLYLELNQSFLGVSFEASMEADQPPLNEAQIHAGKVLTDMLRSKYNIPAENCVTHAQVSVNPDNMHIGWHSDLGQGFPFREFGLTDNYLEPPPSLYLTGFIYDSVYLNATGPGIWKALSVAEERLRDAAAANHLSQSEYRNLLQRRYREEMSSLRHRGADEEN